MDNNNKGEGMSTDELAPHFNRIDQELSLLKALSERRETTKHTVGCRNICGWVHFKEQEIKRINESHAKAIAHHHELHRQSLSQCNELKADNEKLTEMLYERAEHHLEHHQESFCVQFEAEVVKLKAELSKTRETLHGRIHDLSTDNLRLRTAIKDFINNARKGVDMDDELKILVDISKEQPK